MSASTSAITHRFLGIDEGLQQLHLIDPGLNEFIWSLDLSNYPLARDMQRLEGDRVLVGYDHGYFELDWRTGKVLHDCRRWKDVTAATRLHDDSTLVTGTNLTGNGGVNVLRVGLDGAVLHTATRHGDYVRLLRVTPQGTYLLCTNDHILETTPELVEVRKFTCPGFEHAWKAERMVDGTTLVSAGYGAFMAVFDSRGSLVGRFGGADQVAKEVAPHFYASYALLPDGDLLVANWQGHGPDNGPKGAQLLRFDPAGALVATWSAPQRISSLQGLLLV